MQLNDAQNSQVTQWITAGADLAEVQKRLKEELGISMTYMDTRFLVDDLSLVIADKEEPEPEPTPEAASPAPPAQPAATTPPVGNPMAPPTPGISNVSVSIDQVARPDAMISGGVTFSDGVAAKWYIDQMGRLALDADQPGYQPTEADVTAFQNELRKLAQSQGM